MRILIRFCLICFTSVAFSQSNTIISLNKVLSECPTSSSSTDKNGIKTTLLQKHYMKLNENKTELIYWWDEINTTDNKKLTTYTTKIKLKDINYNKIDVQQSNDLTVVTIDQLNNKKTFVMTCSGQNCFEAIYYKSNVTFEFYPNCVEEKLHTTFISLIKELNPNK